MNQETASLDHNLKFDTYKAGDELTIHDTRKNTLRASPLVARPAHVNSSERKLSVRIKGLLVSFGKAIERAMEHDHEFDYL